MTPAVIVGAYLLACVLSAILFFIAAEVLDL